MLSINPSEVIWTILNFFLLLFLLKRFLFKPIITHMDARNARVESAKAEEAEAKESVRACNEQVAQQIADSRTEAKRIIAEAKVGDEKTRTEMVARLRSESTAGRKTMAADLTAERGALKENLQKEEGDLAQALAARLMDPSAPQAPLTRADEGMPVSSRDRHWNIA